MEEADHAPFVSGLFQPFGNDAEHGAVDEDHVVSLRHADNLVYALGCEAEIIAKGHIDDTLQVLHWSATMGLVVDEVGVYVLLAGNLPQHNEVFLAALLAAFGHSTGLLIPDNQYSHLSSSLRLV